MTHSTTPKADRPITHVGITAGTSTDRCGLSLFNRYLFNIGILSLLRDKL